MTVSCEISTSDMIGSSINDISTSSSSMMRPRSATGEIRTHGCSLRRRLLCPLSYSGSFLFTFCKIL